MKILLDGYFDRNFGDDVMMRIVAKQLPDLDFAVKTSREMFTPFENDGNIRLACDGEDDFDVCLRVTGSGFIIPNKIAMLYASKYFLDGVTGKRKRYRSATIGCNIEDFTNPLSEFLSVSKMRENDLLTCRDIYSFDYLKKHVKKAEIHCFSDILFGMDEPFLYPDTGEECLGIVPSYNRKTGLSDYVKKMAYVADKAYQDGRRVLLFSFDSGIENDVDIVTKIAELSENGKNFEVVRHDGDGSSILKGFARCSVVVGTRFHSIVTGLRLGKKVIPIAYNKKSVNMLSDIGFDGKVFDIDTFDETEIVKCISDRRKAFLLPKDVIIKARQHSSVFRDWL